MTDARWKRVSELFAATRALDPAERRTFLDSACSDDTSLRDEVLSLLSAPALAGSSALHDWLRAASRGSDLTMSVCTGAFQLATAGLVDGLAATTHHDFLDRFETRCVALCALGSIGGGAARDVLVDALRDRFVDECAGSGWPAPRGPGARERRAALGEGGARGARAPAGRESPLRRRATEGAGPVQLRFSSSSSRNGLTSACGYPMLGSGRLSA